MATYLLRNSKKKFLPPKTQKTNDFKLVKDNTFINRPFLSFLLGNNVEYNEDYNINLAKVYDELYLVIKDQIDPALNCIKIDKIKKIVRTYFKNKHPGIKYRNKNDALDTNLLHTEGSFFFLTETVELIFTTHMLQSYLDEVHMKLAIKMLVATLGHELIHYAQYIRYVNQTGDNFWDTTNVDFSMYELDKITLEESSYLSENIEIEAHAFTALHECLHVGCIKINKNGTWRGAPSTAAPTIKRYDELFATLQNAGAPEHKVAKIQSAFLRSFNFWLRVHINNQ